MSQQMTPASRSRLGNIEPEPEEDEFFRLLDGGKNTPDPKKED